MAWVVALTGLRVLIAWLVQRTGSTLIAQLAHASYTGGLMMLWPSAASPAQNALWTGAFALVLSVVVWLVASRGCECGIAAPMIERDQGLVSRPAGIVRP